MFADDHRGLRAARERAYQLAETGRFDGAHAVERALIAEGWPNAGSALQGQYARQAVSERCLAARMH
ncbi:MAG: hypothetical protein AB7E60_12495 [Sphingobium sp.]